MQRENEQQPWALIAFYSKCLNAAQKKPTTANFLPHSDRQQRQLSYLAEMTADFEYVAGPLNADALSHPPAGDEAKEVCAVLPADSPRHWEEKELLAAQEEDHLNLALAERLTSTPDFSWAEKKGGPI